MNFRDMVYTVMCVTALFYLMVANARGYVPFVTSISRGAVGTANHFHK